MSKTHFEAFAEMVRLELRFLPENDRGLVAREIASVCRAFNGAFDTDRFLGACEIKSYEAWFPKRARKSA